MTRRHSSACTSDPPPPSIPRASLLSGVAFWLDICSARRARNEPFGEDAFDWRKATPGSFAPGLTRNPCEPRHEGRNLCAGHRGTKSYVVDPGGVDAGFRLGPSTLPHELTSAI